MKVSNKADYRKRRHLRLRQKVSGTAERPRMSVYASNQNLYVQFIDDDTATTLASASTTTAAFSGKRGNLEGAKELGTAAASIAKEAGITKVIFDRGGFPYSGRIKVLAEAAREGGLEF